MKKRNQKKSIETQKNSLQDSMLNGLILALVNCLLTAGAIAFAAETNPLRYKTSPASDRFDRQFQAENQTVTRTASHNKYSKSSKNSTVVAPRGIAEGNLLITQSAGSGGGVSYDPMRRIVKIVETTGGTVTSTKQFVWAGDQLCEERDGSGAVTKRFFQGGEQIAGTSYCATHDYLGSVRELTNGSGAIQSQYNYGPWGEATKLAGSGPDSDMQYAGMYKHQRSGLHLAVNRAYNATQGRWISRDPILEDTFDMMAQSPEQQAPGVILLASADQNVDPDMMAIQGVSSDPIV